MSCFLENSVSLYIKIPKYPSVGFTQQNNNQWLMVCFLENSRSLFHKPNTQSSIILPKYPSGDSYNKTQIIDGCLVFWRIPGVFFINLSNSLNITLEVHTTKQQSLMDVLFLENSGSLYIKIPKYPSVGFIQQNTKQSLMVCFLENSGSLYNKLPKYPVGGSYNKTTIIDGCLVFGEFRESLYQNP